MDRRRLGRSTLRVSPIGFGAFKIGRNEQIKYPQPYELPDAAAVETLVHGIIDLGINLIDTAPAYGLSEERLGAALGRRRLDVVICTKAGEIFANGASQFDFSSSGIRRSVQASLRHLRTDVIDLLLIHSDGRDMDVLTETDAVATVVELRDAGLVRGIGFSGKTVDGARAALSWADAIMIPYNANDTSHAPILEQAATADVGVLVKKGLDSGRLAPDKAIPFVLADPRVASLVVGGLDLDHMRENVRLAEDAVAAHLDHPASRS